MKKYFLILLIAIGFWGCSKKTLPPDVIGDVVFSFDGTIGGDSVLYEAGRNGIYMNTGYFLDSQNLVTLKSSFAQQGCDINCDSILSFELKDVETSISGGLVNGIAGILGSTTYYSYSLDSIDQITQTEVFNFSADFQVGTHYWSFGDGTFDSTANVSHAFTTGGLKTITHKVSSQGITDSLSNTLNTDVNSTCRPYFGIIDSLTTITATNANPSFSNITWTFGNGNTGSGSSASTQYNSPGVYTITMTASSPSCSTMIWQQKVNATQNINQPIPNFSYNTSLNSVVQLLPRVNKSAFIITYKYNGKIYKSYKNIKGLNQSGNPVFSVSSIGAYDNNEKGDKTIKISGSVDTYLYNQLDANDSIKIKSSKLVVAAAYPN